MQHVLYPFQFRLSVVHFEFFAFVSVHVWLNCCYRYVQFSRFRPFRPPRFVFFVSHAFGGSGRTHLLGDKKFALRVRDKAKFLHIGALLLSGERGAPLRLSGISTPLAARPGIRDMFIVIVSALLPMALGAGG